MIGTIKNNICYSICGLINKPDGVSAFDFTAKF